MTKQSSGYVFDTGALALHFAGGSRGEKVKSYFDQVLSGKKEGYISEVTIAEYLPEAWNRRSLNPSQVYKTVENQGYTCR